MSLCLISASRNWTSLGRFSSAAEQAGRVSARTQRYRQQAENGAHAQETYSAAIEAASSMFGTLILRPLIGIRRVRRQRVRLRSVAGLERCECPVIGRKFRAGHARLLPTLFIGMTGLVLDSTAILPPPF